MGNSTCPHCNAPISLPDPFTPKSCTDVDPTKMCREELLKKGEAAREYKEVARRGQIATCEWEDCGHTWQLRGREISYCPRCLRAPPDSAGNRGKGRTVKRNTKPIPNEFPYCHQCGARKAITRQSCRACLQMAPTSSRRFGLSISKWNQFLVTIVRASEVDPRLNAVWQTIRTVMKEDPASRILEEAVVGDGESHDAKGDIIGGTADEEPEEVELAPTEAVELLKDLHWAG